jgi:subtilase family serine protease
MHARNTIITAAVTACTLLSTAAATAVTAGAATAGPRAGAAPAPPASAQCMRDLGIACYSPRQLQRAYNLGPLYARGYDGRGRTIVIVDPYGSPAIRRDLGVFDQGYGLPAPPSLRVLQPAGKVPPFSPKNPAMLAGADETTGDVEVAHEMAPDASILLVELPAAATATGGGAWRYVAAENYVLTRNLGDVISQSFGLPEQNFGSRAALLGLRSAFIRADRRHVSVLAAAGDFGPSDITPAGTLYTRPVVLWPASDPLVTAVGGTELHLDAAGRRTSADTAWNDSRDAAVTRHIGALPWAGGGGTSAIFARPAYQDPVRGTVGSHRGVPDVAMSASFSGGLAVFESFTGAPGVWGPAGGSSVATPELAGIVAIADQYARRRLGLINPALYRLERDHAPGLTDITRGSNTVSFTQDGRAVTVQGYRAQPGYDLVTGVGTINAALLVPELARRG